MANAGDGHGIATIQGNTPSSDPMMRTPIAESP
jgi:hypothetical protein